MTVPPIDFERYRLDSGLKVILHPDRRIPLVHLTLHYRVGSSYEEPGSSGLAHLFEHMMFQGSANVPRNEHGRLVDAAGGRWNASTSKDRTNYYETLPAHQLELALWLESDRMRSLEVTEFNFENQRQTVIEEKRQSYDNRPYGKAYLRFDDLAYSNWAYRHPIIGSIRDLEQATIEDAMAFHRRYYGPGNATLVISGDIPANVRVLVEDYFGDVPDQTSALRPDLNEPAQQEEKQETLEDPLAPLPGVYIGFHMPSSGTPEHYALSMAALILSQGESSRLYQKLVYENNWITNLAAGPSGTRGPQLFTIWFQVQNDVAVDRVIDAVQKELDRLASEPVSGSELSRAINQVTLRYVNSRSTVSGIGESLGRYETFFSEARLINDELDRYRDVTGDWVRAMAETTFRKENRTVIRALPSTARQT